MKKQLAIATLLAAALTVPAIHTKAETTTMSNETGTSSMHGFNGVFEDYHNNSRPKKNIMLRPTLKVQMMYLKALNHTKLPTKIYKKSFNKKKK